MPSGLRARVERWQSLLNDRFAAGRGRPIAYTDSTGPRFETSPRDILCHVVNHRTHHRAQVALVLREADVAPPMTGSIYLVGDA
ncbi:DinB family protein [Salinibacter altiplanensis]|uniref:DinB family protein n=1 Tax=Salinibacter altiplanensis TaxID=1803181 RepID=UPI000C9F2505|nr:DinB family protein [Salinibacter altiplanensis]